MPTLLLIAAVLAGVIILTPLANRLQVPYPVLLTVFGLVLPVLPGIPEIQFEPDLILPVVLPPLLFAATQRATVRQFRVDARPILLLAVGLTVASAAVAATIGHAAGLGWAAAWVLGAVVSPPDPVAATAVARRLNLPHRLVTLLEGEGMFNDATALVMYAAAVAAVVTGRVSTANIGLRLVLAVLVGIAVGLGLGLVTTWAFAALHDGSAETTVTVAMPFAAYLLAEHVGGSGVLAVLVLGLFLRSYGHPAITAGGWLLGRAVWRYADYLITSVVFVMIGFELTVVLVGSRPDQATLWLATVVIAALVVLRIGWMFPAVALARFRLRRANVSAPYGRQETTIAAWAGMRGVVTVATALAIPLTTEAGEPFPFRDSIVLIALMTVLVTLVLQGLTLAPLVRWTGVGIPSNAHKEVAELRIRAAKAALEVVRTSAAEGGVPDPVHRAAALRYKGYLAAQGALADALGRGDDESIDEDYADALDALLRKASEAERDVVLRARRHGEVSVEAADEVLADVEARALRELS